jgi:hypothetical protein
LVKRKSQCFSPKIRNKARVSTLITSIILEVLLCEIWQEKETELKNKKENYLLFDEMITSEQNIKEST